MNLNKLIKDDGCVTEIHLLMSKKINGKKVPDEKAYSTSIMPCVEAKHFFEEHIKNKWDNTN
jgi:hypothetical protein